MLYSAGSGVKNRVVVVLSALSVSWLFMVQSCICWTCAMCGLVCDVSIVMSSAYVIVCTCGGGGGESAMYMLNSVGESTPPCDTPVFMLRSEDLVLL